MSLPIFNYLLLRNKYISQRNREIDRNTNLTNQVDHPTTYAIECSVREYKYSSEKGFPYICYSTVTTREVVVVLYREDRLRSIFGIDL